MELKQVLINLVNIIEDEFGITIVDVNMSLFSHNYSFSAMDVLYIIYLYSSKYGIKIKIKPYMSSYSPKEIAEWLMENGKEIPSRDSDIR